MNEYMVRNLLRDTISTMCISGVPHKDSIKVDGLLAITIDQKQILILKIEKESSKSTNEPLSAADSTCSTGISATYNNGHVEPVSHQAMIQGDVDVNQHPVTMTTECGDAYAPRPSYTAARPLLHNGDFASQIGSLIAEGMIQGANQVHVTAPVLHGQSSVSGTNLQEGTVPMSSAQPVPFVKVCPEGPAVHKDDQIPDQLYSEGPVIAPNSAVTLANVDMVQDGSSAETLANHIVNARIDHVPKPKCLPSDSCAKETTRNNTSATSTCSQTPSVNPEPSNQDSPRPAPETSFSDMEQEEDDAIIILDSPPPADGSDVQEGDSDEFSADTADTTQQSEIMQEESEEEEGDLTGRTTPTTIAGALAFCEPSTSTNAVTADQSSDTSAAELEENSTSNIDRDTTEHAEGQTHSAEEKPFACPICSKAFRKKANLELHINVHSGEKPYACDHCPKRFRLKKGLTVHQFVHCKSSDGKSYVCKTCKKKFPKRNLLEDHVSTTSCTLTVSSSARKRVKYSAPGHEEPTSPYNNRGKADHPVDEPEEFRDSATHTVVGAQRPDVQPQLTTSLTSNNSIRKKLPLKISKANQLAGKSGVSPHFGNESQTVSMVSSEMEVPSQVSNADHSNDYSELYKCKYCEMTFTTRQGLRKHTYSHTGEKPYSCHVCGKTYSNQSNLARHQRKHRD